MTANKYLLADRSKLLKTKLSRLSSKLQGSLNSHEFQTKEQFLFEAIKILGEFYKALNEPRMELPDIRVDNLPDLEVYNKLWNEILDDLITIFTELENIETLTVANFNFITTENNRLTARLKAVSSKLGDYILYSLNPTKDAFFFKDSFNDLSKVEVNSPLLNTDPCDINQSEGIVTLPIDREQDANIVIRENPLINPDSNGIAGNNQEVGSQWNGDLAPLLDNNADTWFEYERVVTKTGDDKEPLVLDITVNLGSEKVINHIRVNPNNFGTKTVIRIDTIETSLDGQVYTSIKDDIPIAGFTTEDEENIFNLAPSTSKYAGQGIYTFTPRKVKYVHFVFSQPEPYVINTPTGERLRYAIGLRDIEIRAYKYKNRGELISTPFTSVDEIRKVLIETNQNPSAESELATINYFISPDDGATWQQLQPKDFTGLAGIVSIREVLEFNGASANTVVTPVPVQALRLKAELKREDVNFETGSSTLNKQQLPKQELHTVPASSPFTIELEEPPVDGTVQLVDPLFGSRGDPDSPYIVGHGITNQQDQRKFRLPFKFFPRPVSKEWDAGTQKWYIKPKPASQWVHVEVGGDEWEHAPLPLSGYTTDWEDWQDPGALLKYYVFNVHTGELEFGNNVNTVAPGSDEMILLWFDPERIYPGATEDNHVAKLDFPTSSNKDDMVIKRYDAVQNETETLKKRATVLRLKHRNIVDTTSIEAKMSSLGYTQKRTFLNGGDELTADTDWSIDTEAGIIYLAKPTPDDATHTLNYNHQPIYTLTEDDWEWATQDLLRDSISIKQTAWKTQLVEDEEITITQGMKVFDVSKLSVMQGTTKFNLTGSIDDGMGGDTAIDDAHNPFLKEVTYIDGEAEFGSEITKTTEQIPAHPGGGVETYDFSERIIDNPQYEVIFSDSTYFSNLQSWGNCVAPGDYAIDAGSGQFQFYSTDAINNPGTVTYYYTNPVTQEAGLFSVDYAMGQVHLQREMDPDSKGDWELVVSYEWTDFRAEYRIARMLDPKSYEVDITNQTVTLKDGEVIKHMMIPHGRTDSRTPHYLVNYEYVAETREDIAALKDYFSPVIKDYAIKVLTKGRIF